MIIKTFLTPKRVLSTNKHMTSFVLSMCSSCSLACRCHRSLSQCTDVCGITLNFLLRCLNHALCTICTYAKGHIFHYFLNKGKHVEICVIHYRGGRDFFFLNTVFFFKEPPVFPKIPVKKIKKERELKNAARNAQFSSPAGLKCLSLI